VPRHEDPDLREMPSGWRLKGLSMTQGGHRSGRLTLACLAVAVLLAGCSLRREQPAAPSSPHPPGWLDSNSQDFHGRFAERDGGPELCAGCHAVSQTDPSTFCFRCHYGPAGGHPDTWTDTLSATYHGGVVYSFGYDQCSSCHGDTASSFSGGRVGVGCYACHSGSIHGLYPDRWRYALTDPHWHGNQVGREGFAPCASCHGEQFNYGKGGLSRGCLPCHPLGRQWGAVPHEVASWSGGESSGPDTTHAYWIEQVQGGSTGRCNHCHFSSDHLWRDGRTVPSCGGCHDD
jgi:hypothetical protein